MDRKGVELPFSAIITGFFLLGAAVLIYLLVFARIQDVHVVLAEYEADVHAINLAQVLMSSDLAYGKPLACSGTLKPCDDFDSDRNGCENQLGCYWCGCGRAIEGILSTCYYDMPQGECSGCLGKDVEHCYVWKACEGTPKPCAGRKESECGTPATTGCTFQSISEDKAVQRGVFDKQKLDALAAGQLDLNIWYPDAIAVVEIEDLEAGNKWSTGIIPKKIGGVAAGEFLNCLINNIKIEPSMIFRINCFISPATCGWEWPDLYKCFTQEVASELAPSKRDFSVAIRVSESEIHSGRMTIILRELVFGAVV